MVWVGRDLKAHLNPLPCHGQGHFHCPRLLQALSNLALDTSRDPGTVIASVENCASASEGINRGMSQLSSPEMEMHHPPVQVPHLGELGPLALNRQITTLTRYVLNDK